MLTERLLAIGAKLKQINTDGILYIIPKNVDYESVLKEWEEITKLTLETEEFEAFYQFAINDYIAVGKGYSETKNKDLLKKKGLFIDKVTLGKGMNAMIIPKAINNFLVDKIPIIDTIYNSKDINDFITYQKVGKKFSVEYGGELIQRINRYYASTNGAYLYKCEVAGNRRYNYENMLCSSGVTIVNNFNELKKFPDNINYSYYIAEANKILTPLLNRQLTLF